MTNEAAGNQRTGEDLPPTLFERIEEVVSMAQDLSLPPTAQPQSSTLNDELVPSLYGARTYIEVGRFTAPEVHSGISHALRLAYRLADHSRKYNTLVNRLRILLEDADRVANDTREMEDRQG